MKAKPKTKKTTKKTAKPTKAKALTQRQQFGKDLQAFEQRVNEKLDAFRQALNGVVEKMWKNIELVNHGLRTAEAHIIMNRKVIDDMLNDILADKEVTAKKREMVDGVETFTDVPARMVNWGHYATWFMAEQAKAEAAKRAAEDQSRKEAEAARPAEGGNGQSVQEPVDKHDPEPFERTAELVKELDQPEAKKEEPQAPPRDDGIPEGAAVFGGE